MWTRVGAILLLFWIISCLPVPLRAAVHREGFETSEITWTRVGADCHVQVLSHARVFEDAHAGHGCELISIHAASGTYVYYSHPIGQARAIAELKLAVWIKANRPGLQLMARVVFPRAFDSRSGEPMSAWIRGSSYREVDRWEQLTLDRIPTLAERQMRMIRSQFGPQFDPREAFVDQVALNVYGGAGTTTVMIDDLSAHNLIDASAVRVGSPPKQTAARGGDPRNEAIAPLPQAIHPVQLQGSILVTNGKTFFPRLIQYQGEPFDVLQSLALNGIILNTPATTTQLEEATRLGLWLVAPPPELGGRDVIGPEYNCVLAWDLGHRLSAMDIDATRRLADDVRRADPISARPLICNVKASHQRFSRYANILLVGRDTFHGSFELNELKPWLRDQRNLAVPGTPVWAAMQTDPTEELMTQWTYLGHQPSQPIGVDSQQMRIVAYMLLSFGARGLCFASHQPLVPPSTNNPRSAAVAALNLELQMLQPWAAAGKPVTEVKTSDPQVRGTVLALDRSRLLLLIRNAPGFQYCVGAPTTQTLTLVVPGVNSSNEAYRITSSKLVRLRQKRVAGGLRIALENFHLVDAVVLTQNPLVIQKLTHQLAANRTRISQLQHDLAIAAATDTAATAARIAAHGGSPPRVDLWLRQARESLQQCQQQLSSRNFEAANRHATEVIQLTGLVRRAHWEQAAGRFRAPVASPALVHFDTLPMHFDIEQRLQTSTPGTNLLPAGNFENLNHMVDRGWSQHRVDQDSVRSDVELTPHDQKSGGYSLRLRALPTDHSETSPIVATAPITIRSARVHAQPGQLVRIAGWAKVPSSIVGSHDGLLVSDSVGGESLGVRIRRTDDWQEFVLYRAADATGELRIDFSLTGIGEALVDAITVTQLAPAPTNPPTATQTGRPIGR